MSNSKLRFPVQGVQILKYGVIGLLSNACGYALYLGLVALGSTPKLTMTVIYVTGALIGFFGNRRLTFSHDGHIMGAGIRFLVAQAGGYAINFLLLIVFVDFLGFPHQGVQALAILLVAVYLFTTLKFFVFKVNP